MVLATAVFRLSDTTHAALTSSVPVLGVLIKLKFLVFALQIRFPFVFLALVLSNLQVQ